MSNDKNVSNYGSLVLTRSPGQSIQTVDYEGNLITFNILEVKGKQVKINVLAPKSQQIYREEIFTKILYENDGEIPGTKYKDDLINLNSNL